MGRGGHRESNRERRGSERDKRDIKRKRQRISHSSKMIERKEGGEQERVEGIMDSLSFSEQSPSRGMEERDGLLCQFFTGA